MGIDSFATESIGASKYLVFQNKSSKEIINYQLQMLTNNEIKNVIKANKRQINNDIVISYDITSRTSLFDATEEKKISKASMINFIKGTLVAFQELEDYQLVTGGIVFDEQYIYVDPVSFEPSYIYVPITVENSGMNVFKELLKKMIINSKVEITGDNFIQLLLEAVNRPDLRIDELKNICSGNMKSIGTAEQKPTDHMRGNRTVKPEPVTPGVPPVSRSIPPTAQVAAVTPSVPPVVQAPPTSAPASGPASVGTYHTPSTPQTPPTPPTPPAPPQKPMGKPHKEKKQKEQKEQKDPSEKNPKKTLLLLLQLVFLGVLVAVSMSGVISDENGNINFQYLGGIALALGCADFVICREIMNRGKEKEEKTEKAASVKSKKQPGFAVPGKEKAVPDAPKGKTLPKAPKAAPIAPSAPQTPPPAPAFVPPVSPEPLQPTYMPSAEPAEELTYDSFAEFDNENTVVMQADGSDVAYLEFYENGLSHQFTLSKPSTIIGKLRSQCDYCINNNKISKIHAEFIKRGNEYSVRDCNSTNGTYINGGNQRLVPNEEYPIYNGDRITLANVDLTFKC